MRYQRRHITHLRIDLNAENQLLPRCMASSPFSDSSFTLKIWRQNKIEVRSIYKRIKI